MPSRHKQNHSEIVFLLLAIVIIIGGYSLLINQSSFLDSAAVAKTGKASTPTGKTYTTPINDSASTNNSSSSSGIASYQQNQSNAYVQSVNPLFYSSNTSNSASNQTTTQSSSQQTSEQPSQDETTSLTENRTISHQSPAQNHTTNNLTSINDDEAAEQPPVLAPHLAPSPSITAAEIKSDSIILIINNPTSTPIKVEPFIEEILTTAFPNEKRVKELLAEELQQEGKEINTQNIEQEWQRLQLLEKEKVKPIYTTKVYHPWNFITTNAITPITYTSKRSSGQLLGLQAPAPFTVPALQQIRQVIFFPTAMSAVERPAKLKLMVGGKEKYTTNFKVLPSLSTEIGVDRNNNLIDIYLSIPQTTDTAQHEYLLEMQIKNKHGAVYYELFGPYQVAGTESALFSQEFRYDPMIVQGRETVTLTIFKDGTLLKKIEQETGFGEGKI